jgi:peptidyl-prolyl cis-trans isomerase D
MLQSIRNNTQSLFAKILVGLIVVVFSLWGVDAIVGSFNGPKPAATVNGEDIEELQVQRAIELRKRELYSRFGESFDPSMIDDSLLRNAAVEDLINRSILSSDAEAQGLSFSDQALDKMILSAPMFQIDGQFSQDAFDSAIRSLGYTRVGFRDMAREDMVVGQIRGSVSATAFTTEREAELLATLEQQQRNYAFTTISRSSLEDSVELTDEQVDNYYQDNQSQYKTEEQVKVEYIQLSIDDFTATANVQEEDIKVLYDETIAEMEITEERKASHILLAVDDETTEQQAVERLTSIKARIDAGESFESLAKEYSDDPGSAKQGGDLGFAGKGTYVEEFEDTLFSMQVGELSNPVITQFGVHLIKLVESRTQDIPTYEELKPRLEQDLRLAEAKSDFVAASEELANSAFSADSLSEVSEELSLPLVTSELFTRDGGEDMVTSNAVVINTVFSDEFIQEGRASDLIELSDEQSLVIRVIDHVASEVKPLDEVKGQVVAALTDNLAQQKARDLADELLEYLRKGGELKSFEANPGLTWSVVEDAARTNSSVNSAINNKAFSIGFDGKAVSLDREILANGDAVVIRLDSVVTPESISQEDVESTVDMLVGQNARVEYQSYQNSLRNRAEIER